MRLLTDDERKALEGTWESPAFDVYRQVIILGKFPTFTFLLHAILTHHASSQNKEQAKQYSDLASAVSLGNVSELVDHPEDLATLTQLAQQALSIDIPAS